MPTRALFAFFCALCAARLLSPPAALIAGVAFALLLEHPYAKPSKSWSKLLLQASVVGLGFSMDLGRVVQAGADGFLYTAAGIALALACGWALGRLLGVPGKVSYLISAGTAICGGSAIAAVAPIIAADDDEISVALGTVFLLNAAGLLLFPVLGRALGLSEERFGLWAALAVHDTSSVVGACLRYGGAALAVGTTVKLARALWIVPMALATAALRRSSAPIQWPWFIGLFLLAAALRTALPQGAPAYEALTWAAKAGLTVTLFLIGSGVSRAALAKVGARPLVQGALLWAIVGAASLAVAR